MNRNVIIIVPLGIVIIEWAMVRNVGSRKMKAEKLASDTHVVSFVNINGEVRLVRECIPRLTCRLVRGRGCNTYMVSIISIILVIILMTHIEWELAFPLVLGSRSSLLRISVKKIVNMLLSFKTIV